MGVHFEVGCATITMGSMHTPGCTWKLHAYTDLPMPVAAVVAGFIEGGTKEEKAAMKKLAEVRAPPLHEMLAPAVHRQLSGLVMVLIIPLVHSVPQQCFSAGIQQVERPS